MSRRRGGSFLFAISICLFAACGGTALVDGANGNAGASGRPSIGAGAPGAGASSVAGSGGVAVLDACSQPKDAGPCEAAVPSFWHDPKTGVCEPFTYGGCQGNDNRFDTLQECNRACPGLGLDYDRCFSNSQCWLLPANCCAACEPATINQFVSVRIGSTSQFEAEHCPGDYFCAACPSVPEAQATTKYLAPMCVEGQCAIADARETPEFTGCQSDADCKLRSGTGCCAKCDGTGWLAVNQTADFCDGGIWECECYPSPPALMIAACEQGKCVANWLK